MFVNRRKIGEILPHFAFWQLEFREDFFAFFREVSHSEIENVCPYICFK